MARLRRGDRLVVASHNAGKVREFADLIAPFGLSAVSASELGLDEPEETGSTFAENAQIKALAACRASGLPALADDSGLEVAALDGAPGIFSARWAGPGKDFAVAMQRVEDELQGRHATTAETRRANFIAALCLAWPGTADERIERQVFEGRVFGTLVWPPRGNQGFGYDPMFLADGQVQTFGEMTPTAKHAMSHRAIAFDLFKAGCLDGDH